MALKMDLLSFAWLQNSLLDDSYLLQKSNEFVDRKIGDGLADWLADHFRPEHHAASNEAQLEKELIWPLLKHLGWFSLPQEVFVMQGKQVKPDWGLLLDAQTVEILKGSNDPKHMAALCEAKDWNKVLDTGKADRNTNPHHQLQDYLATLRLRYGFLTNGRYWRFYDTDKITAKKSFIEFNLEHIAALADGAEKTRALALFAFFFGRTTYAPPEPGRPVPIAATLIESADFMLAVEDNLKAVIYGFSGEDSLFETMGKAIYTANARHNPPLAAVYENSVILLFRLLFVVYFEDRNRDLLRAHPFYPRHSLKTLYETLSLQEARGHALHDGNFFLKHLFEILDEGAEDIDIPLFNGGLFDPARAPLLLAPKLLDNATLHGILERLLFKTHRGETLFNTRRDFKNMSVTHLGRIYEGLLEFRFERAEETATYVEYTSDHTRGKLVEAYFDAYDTAEIRQQKGFKSLREFRVNKGEIYLKSASNSRKTSASYYTPTVLSDRLVTAGIDRALAGDVPLTELRILDNACGSGHFLVAALNHLADCAVERLPDTPDLQSLVAEERQRIAEQLAQMNLAHQLDDAQIIKRLLLKRCIYGVDLNPFAVELARLSLWMDSFIFGTPLSFIEHHIRHGNALIGATIQDFLESQQRPGTHDDLFVEDLSIRFQDLRAVMGELDSLRDTSAAEVAKSKQLWRNRILPRLTTLQRGLDFVCARRLLLAEGNRLGVEQLDKTPNLARALFDETSTAPVADAELRATLADYAARYGFFHYEIAFPEAYADARRGFDVVLGNPPWDKTKFADTDFFPQWHSNYRSQKNSEKAVVQKRLLGSAHIRTAYEQATRQAEILGEYYKTHFPLNRGSGDGNLFRLFIERNLGLLTKNGGGQGGSLNYVLPSALMFEEGSQALRREIFQHHQLTFFHSFENREGLFPDVDSRYKFALMQVCCDAPLADATVDAAFYLLDPAELDDPARHVRYPVAVIQQQSPDQWAMMELRDPKDLPILQKCYAAFAPLSPDWLDFRNELHMTADKTIFLEQAVAGALPLYEGKMIWQFSHLWEQPQYWLDPAAFDEQLHSKELYRMAQDLGVPKKEAAKHAAAVRFDREFIRLGFRDIARDTDERTLIFALLPPQVGVGNTINISIPKTYRLEADGTVGIAGTSPLRLLFALAWFNTLPVDWLARFMIQIHANKTYLYRLPMPQPSDAEIRNNPDYTRLARNALALSLAADWANFAELAPLFDLTHADVPSSKKECDRLRAENDGIVMRLYGITPAEFTHLTSSFKVMNNKRPEYLALLQGQTLP